MFERCLIAVLWVITSQIYAHLSNKSEENVPLKAHTAYTNTGKHKNNSIVLHYPKHKLTATVRFPVFKY